MGERGEGLSRQETGIEQVTNQKFLEMSRGFGDSYLSLIDDLSGREKVDLSGLKSWPQQKALVEKIVVNIRGHQERQERLAEEDNLGTEGLLKQAFPEEEVDRITDKYECDLEKSSRGIFTIVIPDKAYRELTNKHQARAMAVKVARGASFVLMPRHADDRLDQRERNENTPHEINHLVSYFLRKDGIITTNEVDKEWQKAFLTFQEELTSNLCGGGALHGYSHIERKVAQGKIAAEDRSAKQMEVSERVTFLNDMLEEIGSRIKDSDVRKQDLIFSVISSTTFDELEKNLIRAKGLIEESYQPEERDGGGTKGWEKV